MSLMESGQSGKGFQRYDIDQTFKHLYVQIHFSSIILLIKACKHSASLKLNHQSIIGLKIRVLDLLLLHKTIALLIIYLTLLNRAKQGQINDCREVWHYAIVYMEKNKLRPEAQKKFPILQNTFKTKDEHFVETWRPIKYSNTFAYRHLKKPPVLGVNRLELAQKLQLADFVVEIINQKPLKKNLAGTSIQTKGKNIFCEDSSKFFLKRSTSIFGDQIQLKQGCGHFNGLRFASTSYNNEGVKFYLLIVVFNGEGQNQIPENIICSVLSPPIFVDSRKSARNYQEKKYMSFVELFNPNQLQKLFTKRDSKQQVDENKIISNNQEGLYNYLTAPNIRHKVKHPLFLSVKFSNSFKILYNSKSKFFTQKQVTLAGVIKRLQKKLIKQIGSARLLKKNSNILEKQFAIILNSQTPNSSQTKIIEMLQYLESDSIHLQDESSFNGECFVDISKIGDVNQVYKNQYFSLKKKSQNQIQSRKSQCAKKQQDKNSLEKQSQNKFPDNELPRGIYQIQEQQSAKVESQQVYRKNRKKLNLEKQNISEGSKAFQLIRKKVKVNEDQDNIPKYPPLPLDLFRQNHQQAFPRQTFHLEKSGYSNFRSHCPLSMDEQTVKKEESFIHIYINENYICRKIKQMCNQVYQRNKKSIFSYLKILKKSNVKFKIKDVQNFIYSYSNALMSQIYLRERLLHHMYLQNEILKAKAGRMQQIALTDLEQIKDKIMSMGKFLPQSFIISKLKENSLWSDQAKMQKNEVKVAEVRMINRNRRNQECCQSNLEIVYNKDQLSRVQQVSSNEGDDEQISSACHFVPNVFNIPESPMNS